MPSKPEAVHAARDRLFEALEEAGFSDAVDSLRRVHPPATHEFRAAMEDEDYRSAVEGLARAWGVSADWFHEYVHFRAWAATGNTPHLHYGHRVSRPWGFTETSFAVRMVGDAPSEPDHPAAYVARALWPDTRKEEIWDELRVSFDRFWREQVLPIQQQQPGYSPRSRPSDLLRNARAFVIRARLRAEKKFSLFERRDAVADELARRFGTSVAGDSLDRAVSRFASLIGARTRKPTS